MKTEGITIQPYKIIELAYLYKVNRLTLVKWLLPFQEELGVRVGHYYSSHQVKIIFKKLGYPDEKIIEQ